MLMLQEHLSTLGMETRTTSIYRYGIYGITLCSEIPLPLPPHPERALTEIRLRTASAEWFSEILQGVETEETRSWYRIARLGDGTTYVSWEEIGEFLVSPDGKVIVCRQLDEAASESFQVYLLGQAVSFALVNQGFEPLHATAVVIEGEAVVFLGSDGFGKSTLAACFLAAGHRILTDDLLILRDTPEGVLAYPGPARIKLFPHMARRLLKEATKGVPMNPFSRKMILPLRGQHACGAPVPLRAIYALNSPPRLVSRKQAIRIEPLSPREAFFEVVKNTFNRRVVDGDRLERQFIESGRLVDTALVRKLSYPRALDSLPAVCEAILCDIGSEFESEQVAV